MFDCVTILIIGTREVVDSLTLSSIALQHVIGCHTDKAFWLLLVLSLLSSHSSTQYCWEVLLDGTTVYFGSVINVWL